MQDKPDKKEKVLHTRIPETLDREIKHRARNLGMSVSTVVRNVLLHTFDLVEDIVTDTTNVAMSIAGEETRASSPRPRHDEAAGTILGWQEVTLNLNAVCADCNAILATGMTAAIAVRERPGPPLIICPACVPRPEGERDV